MASPRDGFVLVEGVRVDLPALRRLTHRCRPFRCRYRASCCSSYEVFVDRDEKGRLTGFMSDAARYAEGLREEDGYVEPFEETEGGSCLATDEEGRCVFAFRSRRAPTLCSLHAAALDLGLSPHEVKPKACALWPLYYVESDPPLLTVQEDAAEFPCNATRSSSSERLDAGLAGIIDDIWGRDFRTAIESALRDASPDPKFFRR